MFTKIKDYFIRLFKPYPMGYDLETDVYEEWCKEEERRSAVNSIEVDIFLDFYKNLEHKEKYMQSYVDYEGERTYIVFDDWKQEPLNKLANYIYKERRSRWNLYWCGL